MVWVCSRSLDSKLDSRIEELCVQLRMHVGGCIWLIVLLQMDRYSCSTHSRRRRSVCHDSKSEVLVLRDLQ